MASAPEFLVEAFEARFHSTPDLFRAPGRVNLIGEHTDYNLGGVLPIAIDLACYAASAPNRSGVLRLYSLNLQEGREWPVDRVATLQPNHDWTDYAIGVIRQIPQTSGRDIMVYSTVPVGSGLSSSASLEVSCALAGGWDLELDNRLQLAKLCQRAENEFVGLPSGIMDQYASIFGRRNAAIRIDCRVLEHQLFRLPDEVAIVVVNSMVKHDLAAGAYRERVAECRRAVESIRRARPEVESLRDATLDDLPLIEDAMAQRRARHVITENLRVGQFVAAASLAEMGQLFLASHRSLQHDYEVSCAELDFLVDTAIRIPGVYGARMTGGGFGGCTVNLVDPERLGDFETAISGAYAHQFQKDATCFRVRAADGASRIS